MQATMRSPQLLGTLHRLLRRRLGRTQQGSSPTGGEFFPGGSGAFDALKVFDALLVFWWLV